MQAKEQGLGHADKQAQEPQTEAEEDEEVIVEETPRKLGGYLPRSCVVDWVNSEKC